MLRFVIALSLALPFAGCNKTDVTPYSCVCDGEGADAGDPKCEDSAGLQGEWSDAAGEDLAASVEGRCCPDGDCVCACEPDE
jgi:hypothetical protein